MLALVLPWLNPFATGPSPSVVPWLVSAAAWAVWLVLRPCVAWKLPAVVAQAWLVAALASVVVGLLQYFGVSSALGPWINKTVVGEAFGNLRQRNQFATLTNIGLVALACQVAHVRALELHRPKMQAWWARLPALQFVPIAAASMLSIGNAASSSRTGMLELIVLAAVFLWWGQLRDSALRRLIAAAGLAYVLAAFALPRMAGLDPSASGIVARLHDGGPACASRLILWGNVLHLIALKPWLGWGWGELDYAHFTTLYPGARFCDILDNAHNLPLHLAVELGLPVAALVCGSGVWLVWKSRPWRETDPSRQMAWAVMAMIALHSLLEYPLWYGPFQIAVGLCIWILCSAQRSGDNDPALRKQPRGKAFDARFSLVPIWVTVAALLLLAAVAYAGWDYHRVSQIYLAPGMRSPAYRQNTMQKIQGSWLFRNQVRFAELTTTEVTQDNAAHVNALAHQMLHYSPEGRVAEKLIESAVALGLNDEAAYFLARYRAAFPIEAAVWAKSRNPPAAAGPPVD